MKPRRQYIIDEKTKKRIAMIIATIVTITTKLIATRKHNVHNEKGNNNRNDEQC